MSEHGIQHLDFFIPEKFFERMPACVFGVYKLSEDNRSLINCTFAFNVNTSKQFRPWFKKYPELSNQDSSLKPCLGLVCLKSELQNGILSELKKFSCPTFIIEVSSAKILRLRNWSAHGTRNSTVSSNIITYNSDKLCNSELVSSGLENTFINFIQESWELTKSVMHNCDIFSKCAPEDLQFCVESHQFPRAKQKLMNCITLTFAILHRLSDVWTQRIPKVVQKVLKVTTTGKQMSRKTNHINTVLHDLSQNKKITLLSGNLLSALVLDGMLGLLVTCCFRDYFEPSVLGETAIDQTDFVVDQLQQLLYWLMGVPAGLKLNLPLNSALGSFFLYHIYLWKTYMVLIKPFLLSMLELSMYFGILGLSFLISVCTDLVSLATLHIYCFYGYAARIYSLKLSGLFAFWRLFRGKKCNPLRKRVDSYTYDVQQLFLGTLIFTVILFLLPTVALYYAVFCVLRLLVLLLQMVLCKVIDTLTSFPLYAIFLHVLDYPTPKGDVRLKVVSSHQNNVILSLEVISLPLATVLRSTLPTEPFCTMLAPKEILSKVVFGDVIYPL